MKDSKITVVGILGTSYSGSTLLNLILGSHPAVYAGGELSALLINRRNPAKSKVSCTHCGESCVYWTPELLQTIDFPDFYPMLARTFGKQIIVDSSKQMKWFDEAAEKSSNTMFRMLAIVKHPVRLFASFRINAYRRPELAHYDNIDTCLNSICQHYHGILARYPGEQLQIMQYENLVTAVEPTLKPVLAAIGLEFDAHMNAPFDVTHHQIGGNAGPLYQATKKWDLNPENVHPVRRKRYEQREGIYLDNDFLEVLSIEEIERIIADERVQKLAAALNVVWDIPLTT